MPFKVLTAIFTHRHLSVFSLIAFSFIIYNFLSPSPASANYYKVESSGGNCYIRQYSDNGDLIGETRMDGSFCSGASSCSAVAKPPKCEPTQAYVPGSGQSVECDDGGKIRARYVYRNGENNPPTDIFIGATGCGGNRDWSIQGPGRGLHLNVDFWKNSRFQDPRPSTGDPNRRASEVYKIKNGDQDVTIPLNALSGENADYTKPKAFVVYPNCAGQGDSIDAGCFRMATLAPVIYDPAPPTCTVTNVKDGSNFRVDVRATDNETGVARMGLSYTPTDGGGNVTGAEIIHVNNDSLFSPLVTGTVTRSFYIPDSVVASGQAYKLTAKVWDRKGSTQYASGEDYSKNYVECTSRLQCVMPTEAVTFNRSCTPSVNVNGVQYSDNIVTALNLRQSGFCAIDYVNISEIGTTSPDAGDFDWPNYWNREVTGTSSTIIPQGFTKTDTKAPLILGGSKRYWVSYWDRESGQLTQGRSFVTPTACRAPSGAPTITYTPECRVDPNNISDPANPKRELRWNAIPSSQRGDGFFQYRIEVRQSGVLKYSGTSPSDLRVIPFGAYWFTQLPAGNTYTYRVRGESLGGVGPWSNAVSRLLIRKPSAPVNFRRVAFSSGLYSANPFHQLDWTYSDTTAPVASVNGWRMSVVGPTSTTNYDLPGGQTDFRREYTYAQCENTDYRYSLTGNNTCGVGPTESRTYRCVKNTTPHCDPIEYSENNGRNWNVYPTDSKGRTYNPSTQLLLRRHCTDDELNPIRYEWKTSTGCGTFNPAVRTMESPHVNGGLTNYTFPPNHNMGCNLISIVRDSVGNSASNAVVVARTYPLPGAGVHTIALGSRSIQRANTTDAYLVLNGVTQDRATVQYRIADYNNRTEQGSSTNRAGTATINTSTATFSDGKINICHSSYGICTFANPTNSPNITSTRITNIVAEDSAYDITARFTPNHQLNIRDVMVNPSTTNIKYGIQVNFSSTGANGTAISAVAQGSPRVINNPPTCNQVMFGPGTGTPYRQGKNIELFVAGRDDWGLERLRITYRPLAGPNRVTTTVVDENYWNKRQYYGDRYGTARYTINTSAFPSRYYRFDITMWDMDGRSVTCTAADNITGEEVVGTPPITGNPPIILVDKQAPQCGTGGLTVTPNAAGNLLGFTVAGTDPTVNSSYSGLSNVSILAKKPNETAFSATPVLVYSISAQQKPQSYTHTFSNASAATSYNLANLPSGQYAFRAVWTDRGGNVSATPTSPDTACDVTYEKRSRISGKVNMFTGLDGLDKRDYAREADGDPFSITTRTSVTPVDASWIGATPAACQATYPGVAGLSSCAAYFVSGAEYSTATPPIVELRFPRLASDTSIGKYRCIMSVWDTTARPSWRRIRETTVTDPAGTGATCSGTTCVCRFSLTAEDMTIDPNISYTANSIWPTHVEFDVSYNSDQVYGRVEDEIGNTLSGNTVTVSRGAWSSTPAAVSVTGAYTAPTDDDTGTYARTNQPANVTLNNADPTRLCIWAARNDFANPGANNSRSAASSTFANAAVRTVAQQLALTGFTVGVSAQCTAPVNINSGPVSPKHQNQVNFISLPKVQITGQIYYLRNDNMCGEDWTDTDNHSTDAPLPVNLDFGTITPPPPNGALGEFLNPTNPTSLTGAGAYTTGQTYNVYANALPGSDWDNWQIQANVTIPAAGVATYAPCEATTTIDVSDALPNYPIGAGATVINRPIAVYMTESNDWWQTYNGGVHAFNSITNRIPAVDAARENLCGHDIHTIVGRGNCAMYNAGAPLLRNPFRGYTAGGLVTTRGVLQETAGRDGFDWRITASTNWRDPDMEGLRLPFTTSESTNVTAIERVDALGTTEGWVRNPGNLTNTIGTGGNGRAYFSGDQTINNPLTFGNNNYIVIDGDLTINANLLATGTGNDMRQTIFIIAAGDVTIGGTVTELNAYIYTPGNITINSGVNGADDVAEVPLKVYGGLYAGGNVDFRRDLPNTAANWGYPTTQIMFNPALILRSRQEDFPSQLKETNVYWTQE